MGSFSKKVQRPSFRSDKAFLVSTTAAGHEKWPPTGKPGLFKSNAKR